MKERRSEPHAKRVCRALWHLCLRFIWPVFLLANVTFYASLSSPCFGMRHNVALSNDCEVLSEVKMDLISQFYHLYDVYYIKVLERNCESGTVRVCVLKDLSTNTSIVFEQVPTVESPLCDHNPRPNCLRSYCSHDNYLGLSLLHPNQSIISYLILDIGDHKVYRKKLTDQPQSITAVWIDMIPRCYLMLALGPASLIIIFLINAIWYVHCCSVFSCIPCIYQKCKRWVPSILSLYYVYKHNRTCVCILHVVYTHAHARVACLCPCVLTCHGVCWCVFDGQCNAVHTYIVLHVEVVFIESTSVYETVANVCHMCCLTACLLESFTCM